MDIVWKIAWKDVEYPFDLVGEVWKGDETSLRARRGKKAAEEWTIFQFSPQIL